MPYFLCSPAEAFRNEPNFVSTHDFYPRISFSYSLSANRIRWRQILSCQLCVTSRHCSPAKSRKNNQELYQLMISTSILCWLTEADGDEPCHSPEPGAGRGHPRWRARALLCPGLPVLHHAALLRPEQERRPEKLHRNDRTVLLMSMKWWRSESLMMERNMCVGKKKGRTQRVPVRGRSAWFHTPPLLPSPNKKTV